MPINKKTNFGNVKISDDAIAKLVGSAVSECYGVVGVTSKSLMDSVNTLLKIESYSKGVIITNKNNELVIDLYLILSSGVKISEVILEVQKRVKYIVEKTLDMDVAAINCHVEGIKG